VDPCDHNDISLPDGWHLNLSKVANEAKWA
jgi:hypothetical protein